VDSARQTLAGAPDQAIAQARGNPLAAGLIAFGGGLLLASLLPSTQPEQQAAQTLRDRFEEPVKQQAQQVAQDAKEALQPAAQQAAESVKQTAQEGVERTRDDATSSAQQVQGEAQAAGRTSPPRTQLHRRGPRGHRAGPVACPASQVGQRREDRGERRLQVLIDRQQAAGTGPPARRRAARRARRG
jgi:hypothetical protein